MLGSLGGLLLFFAITRLLFGGSVAWSLGLVGTSVGLLGAWALSPAWLVRPAAALHRVLTVVGDVVSHVLFTVIYVVVVWPYAAITRRLGLVEPAEEPWPPPAGTSGWRPVDPEQGARTARRSRGSGVLVRLAASIGGAVVLLRFVWRRAAVVFPIAALLVVLGILALFGSATGLGPLVYSLF